MRNIQTLASDSDPINPGIMDNEAAQEPSWFGVEASGSSASVSPIPPGAKVLQFVTVGTPADIMNAATRKAVRAHVMRDYHRARRKASITVFKEAGRITTTKQKLNTKECNT